jgi:serine/threonine protein kinase/formylglycine-generating enzyme required for sulfatase activity
MTLPDPMREPSDRTVHRIGDFRILRKLGEGGMGIVFEAEQGNPRRRVALKVVRATHLTPELHKRFEREAHVLGLLQHPGIAQIYQAGTADPGDGAPQPYFAMELVQGPQLTLYAREQALTSRQRLELLARICDAVQHAHQKGVVHRDLKPGNILVVAEDASSSSTTASPHAHSATRLDDVAHVGQPKILDFGLARITESDLPAATLQTEVGQILGTVQYMSPEQVTGDSARIDTRSDIYALGVIGYELLCGRLPHDLQGRGTLEALRMIREEVATPLSSVDRALRGDVETILAKALEKDPTQRYPTAADMAADIRRYLRDEPILARPPSALYQVRKFAARNKVLVGGVAAVFLALVAGLIGTAMGYVEARRNETIATQRANDVLSLSASKDLDDLAARADKLWPARPERIGDFEQWLTDARELIEGRAADPARNLKARPSLAQHKAKLVAIRAQALPQTDEERRAERESHPRFVELLAKRSEATWRSRMLGLEEWPNETDAEDALASESLPADASALNELAWSLVDPEKPVYGSELKALVLARRAIAAAAEGGRASMRDSLAWAYFRLGRFDEALGEELRALDEVDASRKVKFEGYVAKLEQSIASWSGEEELTKRRELRDALVTEVAELELAVGERRTWEFTDPEASWWQLQLSTLASRLEALRDPTRGLIGDNVAEPGGWGVTKRYEFARTIRERSVDGIEAKARWGEAVAAISASAKYAGLKLVPQMGLLPIGPNPESGLWEFADLQTGEPAVRGADGKLVLTESMGLVFVLIPGGTFAMGAQSTEPTGPNYDRQALSNESPVHDVTLTPYFLSKYELTQGQWQRFTGHNPSTYGPSTTFAGHQQPLLHPVEQVSWTQCVEVLTRLGLVLPSQAQWERGCRAETDSPWWTGVDRESLRGKVNLADRAAARARAAWPDIKDWPDLDDGCVVHAAIGSLPPNPFGLHEVHGNVWEWCRDGYGNYSADTQADPVAPTAGASNRVIRGGSFDYAASGARSAYRNSNSPESQNSNLGLRPVRAVSTL